MKKNDESENSRRGVCSSGDGRIYEFGVNFMLFLIIIVTLYPIIYVLSVSLSNTDAVAKKEVWLWPVGFSLESYKLVFKYASFLRAYMNTVFYTVAGTAYSMILTIFGAYPLSRKNLPGRNAIMLLIFFTMLFGGGLIPTFLVVNKLHMYNTYWAVIVPCAVSQYNLIVLRTFMSAIPDSLEESAKMDGANDFVILFRVFLPMSVPAIATISLFYGVAIWNNWFSSLIYQNDSNLFPVQLLIRNILVAMTDQTAYRMSSVNDAARSAYTPQSFRCAVIIVTMLPVMCIYPFIQKYFVKGVMIGAVKG